MPRSTQRAAERVSAFAPILGRSPRLLILGSLPGAASVAAGEYYAHPRNLFWPFMGELFGAGPDLPYARRVAALKAAGIGVWDVLASAERAGSLDAAIALAGAQVNDIAGLLRRAPRIERIAFNGATAAALFRRLIAPQLPQQPALQLLVLPSTSPANAGTPRARKLAQWSALRAGP